MKLPHISIEYRDEETFAPDKVSLGLIAGFGLHWAWVWLVIFNGPKLFYPNNPALFDTVFMATISIFAVTLLCYGVFFKQFRNLFSTQEKRLRNRSVGAVCVMVGTALLLLLNTNTPSPLFIGLSALCNGLGSAVLLMSFGVSTSVLDIAEAVACTTASFCVATLTFIAAIALNAVFAPAACLLCLCLPAIEFVCLRACSKQLVDRMEFSTYTLSVHTAPFALHVCGPMLVLGLLLGFIRPFALFDVHQNMLFANTAIMYFLGALCVAILAMSAMMLQRQRNNFMFRTLFPVAALLLMLEYLLGQQNASFNVFSLFSAYLIFEMCSWVMLADISQRFRISAFTTFGFGRGALAVGALIGYLVTAPAHNGLSYFESFDIYVVVMLALLLLCMALLPKNIELRNTLKLGKLCPALQGDEQFAAVTTDEFKNTVAQDALHAQNALPHTDAAVTAAENADEPISGPEEDSEATSERIEAIDAMQERIDAEEREKQRQGRFKRKCATVADTYLLSRKETEVLFLLAKGRNAAAIQEQLYISAGTANTHMRHIYRKLNVHSQQELIALVEETEVDDIDWDE